MPLLDFFSNPNVAAAAGLLSPTRNKNFGQGLLQGINAGQGSRQNNTQDQLAQLRAQIANQGIDDAAAFRGGLQNAPAGTFPPGFNPQNVEQVRAIAGFTGQKRSPFLTMTPGSEGALVFNSRSGQMGFQPYPQGFGGPVAQDPSHQRNLKEQAQLGLGGGEIATDPRTAAATILAENEANKAVARPQKESQIASIGAKTEMLDKSIDQAIDQSGVFTAGFLGSASSWIPGTPAFDLSNTLGSIRANIGFDKLRELKDAGGTLGQVSEKENVLLQQVWGSIEQAQSDEQLKDNLENVRRQVKESWGRVNKAYKAEYGTTYKGSANPPPPEDVPQQVWDAMTEQERALWR